MKRTLYQIILFGAVLLAVAGCYYDSEESLYPEVTQITLSDTVMVSFKNDVVPILQTYCYECHSNANAATKGKSMVLEGYSAVKSAAANNRLYGSISWNPSFVRMPYQSSKLPPQEIFIIKRWVDEGTPDN